MKNRVMLLALLGFLGFGVTGTALAAGESASDSAGAASAWWMVLPVFAMALASSVCAIAQSRAMIAACDSVARNPGAAESIRFFLILGLVLIESLALYTLLIIFVKV